MSKVQFTSTAPFFEISHIRLINGIMLTDTQPNLLSKTENKYI